MASEMLGRAACPECGFASAHIKIKTDKEKARPYRHCPECGAQYFPRNQQQDDDLRKKIGGAKLDGVPSMRPLMEPEAAPAPVPTPAKAEEPKSYRVVFGVRVPT